MEGSKLAKTQEGDQAGFKSSALHDSHKPSFMRVSVGNMINSTDQATPVAGASVKKAISGTSTLPTKPKLKVSQVWPDRQQENAKLGSSDDAKLTTPNIPKTGLPSYSGNDSEGVEIVKLDEEHTLKPHEEEIVDMRFSENNPDTENLEPKSRGKSELKRAATSQSVLFEFGDDESNNKKLLATGNQYFFPEFEVNYDIMVYLEFIIHHLLYYAFFGIVVVVVLIPFRKARILLKNLQFIPDLHYFFILQVVFWINSILTLLAMFFFGGSNPITNVVMLVTNQLSLITRASNIAAKYATFPPARVKLYRNEIIPMKEFRSQLLLADWAKQGNDVIELEYLNAMHRNGFDTSIFRFSFLDKPNEAVERDLDFLEKEQHLDSSARNIVYLDDKKTRTYYHGGGLFMAIVRKFNATKSRAGLRMKVQVLAIIWGLTPLLVKLALGRSIINNESVFDTVAFYLGTANSWFLFAFTNLFYAQAKYDIQRTIYIMAQLSHLISTQKKTTEEYKVLPTMNFMEEYSLNSWKIMRRLAVDYGKQYFHRHEIFLPVMFVLALGSAFAALGLQIIMIYFPTLELSSNIPELQISLMVYCILFLLIFTDLLLGFSEINEWFASHIVKLNTIKNVICDLRKYQDHYFRKYYAVQCPLKAGQGCNKVFRQESESHVHRRLAKEIADTLGAEHLETEVRGFLQNCGESVESIIAEITVDQAFHSITILGFVITKSFTFNLLMVLLSVGGTAYQMFVPNGPISSI